MEDTRDAIASAGLTLVTAIENDIRDGRGCSDGNCSLPTFFDDLTEEGLDAVIRTLGRMLAVRHDCYVNACLYHMIQERESRRQDEYPELIN